jgi:hypothetical protein
VSLVDFVLYQVTWDNIDVLGCGVTSALEEAENLWNQAWNMVLIQWLF